MTTTPDPIQEAREAYDWTLGGCELDGKSHIDGCACASERAAAFDHLRAVILAHDEQVKALADATCDLVDADPCRFDHHGYCQAHYWLSDGVCPHERAKAALNAIRKQAP